MTDVMIPFEMCCSIRIEHAPEEIRYKEFLLWEGMTVQQCVKWRWYFRYRQALLQIKYPKYEVSLNTFQQPLKKRSLNNSLINAIRGKKAKLTEARNKLRVATETWDEIFPIESDPLYPKVIAKISRLEAELQCLENQFNNIEK
jgi:hypothetical protein